MSELENFRNEVKELKKDYKYRIQSLKETLGSKEFEKHYQSFGNEAYIKQSAYVSGKIRELDNVLRDLTELLK